MNNFYGYNPYFQPNGQTQESNPIWVQGINGAKSYLVAPGRSAVLFDSESTTFYIKQVDINGVPQPLRIYDYTERAAQPQHPDMSNFVTKDEINQYISDYFKQQKESE